MQPAGTDFIRSLIVFWSARFLFTLAVVFFISWVWMMARRGPATLCSGPRRRRVWLRPWAWVRRGVCGYDLTGLPAFGDGSVQCPECGTRLGACDRRRRFGAAWRLEVLAGAFLAVALTCRYASYLHGGRWLRELPAPCLLALESIYPSDWSGPARAELGRLLRRGELWGWESRWLARVAVAELGDDSVTDNAGWARGILVAGCHEPLIEAALESPDRQTRQLAADILRARCGPDSWMYRDRGVLPAYTASDRLIEVTVEGLRDDDLPRDRARGAETWVSNGFDGLEFLVRTGQRAAPACGRALESDDPQQRILAAAALGMMGATVWLPRAAPILVGHLRDNRVDGDARLAATALAGFGPGVLAYLEAGESYQEEQVGTVRALVRSVVTGTALAPSETQRLNALFTSRSYVLIGQGMEERWRDAATCWGTAPWPVMEDGVGDEAAR